jgi:peroxiredoxin
MFELPDAGGDTVSLKEILAYGPAVVIFYRGGLCPSCQKSLSKIDKALPQIHEPGTRVIAISPQTVAITKSTAVVNGLPFHVLSNSGLKVAREFGLDFELKPETVKVFQNNGIDFTEASGSGSWELPVPIMYIISQDVRIAWAYANEDFKVRAQPERVIVVFRALP